MERALSLLTTAALAAALAAALTATLTADSRWSRACWGGGSRGLRGRWLLRHRLWRFPSWFLSWPTLFGLRLLLNWSTLLFGLRLLMGWPMLFGLRLLLNWPAMLFCLRLFLSWPMLFGLRLLLRWPTLLSGLWRFLVHRRTRLLSPGRWHVVIGFGGNGRM